MSKNVVHLFFCKIHKLIIQLFELVDFLIKTASSKTIQYRFSLNYW